MLTIGHELGHVLTKTLSRHHDEEAKAYAFSLVWIDAIKKNNIANLSGAIITELRQKTDCIMWRSILCID